MKTNLILALFLLFAFEIILYSQESIVDGKLYKNAQIIPLIGNTFNANFTIKGDSINMLIRDSKIEINESLQKINRIEIPTRPEFDTFQKNTLKGTGIGFGIGIVATVITTYLYQLPREGTLRGIPWHCSEVEPGDDCDVSTETEYNSQTHQVERIITTYSGEYTMKLAFGPKIMILGGSTLIGFLNGIMKKELKIVYLNDSKALKRINYNIYYNPYINNMNFNLSYKF